MNLIEVEHLSKYFGEKKVLSDVSLSIEKGKTTCLMGPSGCGKTTLLRILAGLDTPDEGTVRSEARQLSFVFQDDRLSENYSAVSNIKFVVGNAVPRETIIRLLTDFGLGNSLDKPVGTLSGGMKRRVAIARALCAPYDLLIMDEPLKGLDDKRKRAMMDIMKRETRGKTVVYVTHDVTETEFFADHTVMLNFTR